ncbi:hypothetical protein MGYG_05840 [Nannizzia gypsea CBS 118893]|uniref:Clr5 domain-containing protein n=1 Tax=Arthroderma gypseum (strain ATCC MYA-4604 / CBS 118893) TaxID=535722 RepID=E4UY60_ARTGP|nr:hypothetical protein MGYG_05840 [Nannizzia gypsea CBS 118893]EFR02840.1 hypothetical protein MGYG_05840 [Nannizzia gypsea CBS 118893]
MASRRNLKQDDWNWVEKQLDKRADKRSVVLCDGVPIDERRLQRSIKRHRPTTTQKLARKYQEAHPRILIRTPASSGSVEPPPNQISDDSEYQQLEPDSHASLHLPSLDWHLTDEQLLSQWLIWPPSSPSDGEAGSSPKNEIREGNATAQGRMMLDDALSGFLILLTGELERFQVPLPPIPDAQPPEILEEEARSQLALITSCVQLGHEEAGQKILAELLRKIGADHGESWSRLWQIVQQEPGSETDDGLLAIFRQRLADFEALLGQKNETLMNLQTFMAIYYFVPEMFLPAGDRKMVDIQERLVEGAQFLLRPLAEGLGEETANALITGWHKEADIGSYAEFIRELQHAASRVTGTRIMVEAFIRMGWIVFNENGLYITENARWPMSSEMWEIFMHLMDFLKEEKAQGQALELATVDDAVLVEGNGSGVTVNRCYCAVLDREKGKWVYPLLAVFLPIGVLDERGIFRTMYRGRGKMEI